jgi:hypothetical protein
VLLAVAGDVERGHLQEVGIIPEESEALVAPLTQEPADRARGMIMIKMLRRRITAYCAPIILRRPHFSDVILAQLVSAIEVGGTALGVLACLASTTEPRWGRGATRVVLVRHRLLTTRAPSVAGWDPRVVADNLSLAPPMFAVPTTVARTVADQAVERQSVREALIATEGEVRERLTALRATLHRYLERRVDHSPPFWT